MPTIIVSGNTLSFNNIYYVDAVNGSDTTGDGSELSPYKTMTKAVSMCATNGDAIFFKGTNSTPETVSGIAKTITLIGNYLKYKSRFVGQLIGSSGSYLNLTAYNIYLDNPYTGTWDALFTYVNANLYNCVVYDRSGYSNVYGTYRFYNCYIFRLGDCYSSSQSTNCAFYTSRAPSDMSTITCMVNITSYTEQFEISVGVDAGTGTDRDGSPADIGVYGGQFGWPRSKILVTSGNDIYTLSNGIWTKVGSLPINDFVVDTYGMYDVPLVSRLLELENPELLIISRTLPIVTVGFPTKEIYYAVSMDGETWYSCINNEWIECIDMYLEGMTKQQVESINFDKWSEIFIPGNLYFKILIKTNDSSVTPYIDQITVNLPEAFNVGSYYVLTNLNQINTLDWKIIESVVINQETPNGTDVRYAFSLDNRFTWIVYDNGWKPINLNDIHSEGMTIYQIQSLNSQKWQTLIDNSPTHKLDVAVGLKNTDIVNSPKVDSIIFNYTRLDLQDNTEFIKIPIPEVGYRNTLIEEEYVLKLAEGIGFDSVNTDYDFYTTPDRIYLKSLDAGNYIGGRDSNVHAVEVINGYEDQEFEVTIIATTADGQIAEPRENYCLLPDHEEERGRTKIELSQIYDNDFSSVAEYPLTFNLAAQAKKVIYIKINPTIYSTVGSRSLKLQLKGRPL